VPNFTVMAPRDEAELQRMMVTAIHHDGPCALRIPRGEGEGVPLMEEGWEPLQVGRGELLTDGDDLLIVAYGAMVYPALATAGLLQERGVRAAVINARFLRPLDEALIVPMARRIGRVVTMEEGCLAGGFGAAVVETLNDRDVLVPVLRLGIPDVLVDHASPDQSKQVLGLTPPQMCERILERFPLVSPQLAAETVQQPLGV
jgi:1-deoxy-D-xylulose-5-phosphate synthase